MKNIMTRAEFIAKSDRSIRQIALKLSPSIYIAMYSYGRKFFLKLLSQEEPKAFKAPEQFKLELWELEFACPLFNSAGIFKTGEGYKTVALQGAGAYLAGTTTSLPRKGNRMGAIVHPFVPLPKSHSAINWMGLPNPGNNVVAKKLSELQKIKGCPIGASIAGSPELSEKEALLGIVEGMQLYEKANVDFIELNESCPNVEKHKNANPSILDTELLQRLEYISSNFLNKRKRNLPVILKLSVDTEADYINPLIDALLDLGFDGINFGNTSTNYEFLFNKINPNEQKICKYFWKKYGGGISGNPLKEKSLILCKKATKYLESKNLNKEFHIIRTGGIEDLEDILESKMNGILLNQWFTGYFENFSKYGHKLYKALFT